MRTFRLTILVSGEDRTEDSGEQDIKAARVQFRPGKGFKEVLKNLKFHPV